MEQDAFGGPFTCQITHQSVGFGYSGAVTGTAPERGTVIDQAPLTVG